MRRCSPGVGISVFILLILQMLAAQRLYAAQSTITEAEGSACMGDDRSRKQTEQAALAEAKRRALEDTVSYMKSESRMKNAELEKDIVEVYSNASVKVLQEVEKGWQKDASAGDCYRVKIRAEIEPDKKAMEKVAKGREEISTDPSAPLAVSLWTDKKEYKKGDRIKVLLKGNKPFYARVVYKDAGGQIVQLLPNPFREDNYFNGGAVYEIPSGNDEFDLEVTPPFGAESIVLYAGTSQLGEIDLKAEGAVYGVETKEDEIGAKSRGIKIAAHSGKKGGASEFSEVKAEVKTGK